MQKTTFRNRAEAGRNTGTDVFIDYPHGHVRQGGVMFQLRAV